jgi:uncharacterized membrane protein
VLTIAKVYILIAIMARSKLTVLQSLQPVLMLSSLSVAFFIARVIVTRSERYWFLNWNLALAWPPLIIAYVLRRHLGRYAWSNWKSIMLVVCWLVLVPNTFYLVSDFVHLDSTVQNEVSLLYDISMFMSYALTGLALGCVSMYMVHMELKKRLGRFRAWSVIGVIILLDSFAIYLGRFLGWNSWDLFINPAGIITDISDRIINPTAYPNTFTITLLFFVFIMVAYGSFYSLLQTLKPRR